MKRMKREATDSETIFATSVSDKNLDPEYMKNSENSITGKQMKGQNI